jgi:CDP-glucose 4,6-dehydratase
MGTVHVFEAVRQVEGVRVVVNITSDKCYENREWVWGYREEDPMGGHDPYSNSKGCAELVTSAYRCSFFNSAAYGNHGVAIASARAGNVIGGGDWADDRLIPDFMRAITAGQPIVIRNPHAIRPWQHVLEPLGGYMLLAERLWSRAAEFAEAWNFGPHEEDAKPVEWIVERLIQLWGKGVTWQLDGREHPHEAHYLKLDTSKARMKLGWQPRWNLETALQSIAEWHRVYLAKGNMRETTLEQILAYQRTSIGEHVETSHD